MEWKNKKVLVMGLGTHGGGVGTARYLAKKGAKVRVTDLKPASQLASSLEKLSSLPIKFTLGKHRPEDFLEAEVVVRNPDVPKDSPFLKIAQENGAKIEMESSIFFEELPSSKTIGITGTKGKTTTTMLVYQMLKEAGKKVVVGGNLEISLLELLPQIDKDTWVVAELSSWQTEGLEICQKSPHVAVITNIFPDHLNRYQKMEKYVEAKKFILKYQNKNDYKVLNKNNPYTPELTLASPSKNFFFEKKGLNPQIRQASHLLGEHNLENLAAMETVGKILGIKTQTMVRAVKQFSSPPHRLEKVREIKGVTFYNDSAATNPDAAIAALGSFGKKPIIWILGGADKNLDFKKLATTSTGANIKAAILLNGSATPKIKEAFEKANISFPFFGPFDDFEKAVKKAYQLAGEKEVVLLSPGVASFGMFKNEFDRGEKFKKIVNSL